MDCTQENLKPRIQKINNTIKAWQHRELSFKGKTLVINGLLTSTLWYTATSTAMPPWAISELEKAIYNFFWDNKSPPTNRDVLALPTSAGGFDIHHIQSKIAALRLNTLRQLLNPEHAHWKLFTQHFLRASNMHLGKLTLVKTFYPSHIDKDIPSYHQELLHTWITHRPHHTRTNIPSTIQEILNKPIFRNDLIEFKGQPIYNRIWINAGITQVKDICYLAIPGLLPTKAIHEIISQQDGATSPTLAKTTREVRDIIKALLPHWLRLIHLPPPNMTSPKQPCFTISNTASKQPPLDIAQGNTRTFNLHLAKLQAPNIDALQQWRNTLHPAPTFNHKQWKLVYPPLIKNTLGDTNWKILQNPTHCPTTSMNDCLSHSKLPSPWPYRRS